MSALTAQVQRERQAMTQAWKSGFAAGCVVTAAIVAGWKLGAWLVSTYL